MELTGRWKNRMAVCVAVLLVAGVTRGAVKAWEGTVTIPTYGWADDVNPKLWALENQAKFSITVKGAIVYPYTMQDHLSRTKEDRTYRALFLENEYLKVTCLPELGGRLHSVFDKTQGKEMFHLNDVIKPSMIAMRGAWISGGVEWNAGPQGHTVTILSPVNAVAGRNEDGSGYIEVGTLEKSLRVRWTVRVTLRPGRAYLDEQIRIFNPTDAVSPYYFWNCTAFPNRPGTRFIYPMTLGTDHNAREFFNWPIHEGKDLSWLKNYETYASVFAVDCTYDFFGAYDVDADRGIVQVADHRVLGGKKAWTWGTWDFGIVSQKNLADDGSQYIEVQSGPLPTQSDYGMLLPRQEVAWREWWYPAHGLGDGFEYATKDAAVQTARRDGQLELRILATSAHRRAECVLSREGRELLRTRVDLSPADARSVVLTGAPDGPVDVAIRTAGGWVLAAFTTPLPIPKTPAPQRTDKPDEEMGAEELYLKGRGQDLAMDRPGARRYYEKALVADSQYSPALRSLAVLDLEAGLYEKAVERLRKALEREPADGLAWYFLGVSQLKLGHADEALNSAYRAIRCPDSASLGHDLAGRAYMRMGEYANAVEAFETAVRLNPQDAQAHDHRLIAMYACGNRKAAVRQARARSEQNPTELVPRAILALGGAVPMHRFVREVRDYLGEDDFEMIELALGFSEAGFNEEARVFLGAVCGERGNPLVMYCLAYFSGSAVNEAARMWRDFIFPSRPEMVPVLAYALERNPADAHGHLHIGNLYGHLGRLEEAAAHWRRAAELNPSLSIALRNLGLYAWTVEKDLGKAEGLYRKAIAARPTDQTLYRDLADILLAAGNRPAAIEALEATPTETMRRADVIIMLAQGYLDEKRHEDAIGLLESTPYFVNWEGQSITWDIFNRAHIGRGREHLAAWRPEQALRHFETALTYPENIGVGRSNKPREAPAQYWRGKALEKLGRTAEARAAWEQGAAGPAGGQEQDTHRELCKSALSEVQ